jgi:hypothetical protein
MLQSGYNEMGKSIKKMDITPNNANIIQIKRIDFIVVLLITYVQYSLWFLEYSGSIRIVLTLGLLGILLVFHNFKIRITIYSLIIFCLSTLCILISCLVNGIDLQFDVWTISIWFCAFLISSTLNSYSFYEAYTKTITFLAFFGTLIFCISLIMPSIFIHLPILDKQNWTDAIINNAFLGNVSLYSNFKRNFGIFYEPGLFALHLNFAVYLELFVLEKPNSRRLAILLPALLSTFSTNGFISVVLFLAAYFFKKHKEMNKYYANRIKKISVVIAIITTIILVNSNSILLFLTNKLFQLNSSSTFGSGFERFRAMNYSLEAFLTNPFLGLGGKGFVNFFYGDIATFTPLNWFALYGIVYGLLCFILYTRIVFVGRNNFISMLLQLLGLLTLIMSQNVSNYLIIIIFMLYNANSFGEKNGYRYIRFRNRSPYL